MSNTATKRPVGRPPEYVAEVRKAKSLRVAGPSPRRSFVVNVPANEKSATFRSRLYQALHRAGLEGIALKVVKGIGGHNRKVIVSKVRRVSKKSGR